MNVVDVLALISRHGVAPAGITSDSRRIGAGEVFAAWPGATSDGRRFIADAFANGAAAALFENGDGFKLENTTLPAFGVAGLRSLAGFLAHEIYGHPSEKLWLAGVTGTNGKTTVSQWLARALTALGARCGVIGTLGNGFPDALETTLNTTPDALDLHRLLAGFLRAGASAAAMEVSSIGLDQERVNGAAFDVAIFTNLTRDHIDYHGSMEAYGVAKAKLFDFPGLAAAVVNLDDEFGVELAKKHAARGLRVIGYTLNPSRAAALPGIEPLTAGDLRVSATGQAFGVAWEGERVEVDVRLAGAFNVSNLLAVLGALLAKGVALPEALAVAKTLTPPPGRMQLIGGHDEPLVVVDYAHTPDALAKVLEAARPAALSRGGELVCVFGCGGDRDAGKRPQMGAVASRLADRVLVTSDNPRSEEPERIVADILEGTGSATRAVIDRAEAIRAAIVEADARDVIVLAGKGHEPYQEIRGARHPFSDVEHAAQALAARRGRASA